MSLLDLRRVQERTGLSRRTKGTGDYRNFESVREDVEVEGTERGPRTEVRKDTVFPKRFLMKWRIGPKTGVPRGSQNPHRTRCADGESFKVGTGVKFKEEGRKVRGRVFED